MCFISKQRNSEIFYPFQSVIFLISAIHENEISERVSYNFLFGWCADDDYISDVKPRIPVKVMAFRSGIYIS